MTLTGLVLAGGRSTRMGRNKAEVVFRGTRLIDLAVQTLSSVCDEVAVAARDHAVAGLDVPSVDDAEGDGPLAGIVAGLRVARTPLLAVVAVDMPLASGEVFVRLAGAWDGEAAVAPHAGGAVQPLHALYATGAVDRFARLLAAGEHSPRRAIERLGGRVVGPDVYDPRGVAGPFWTNVNSPADLAARQATPPGPG